MTPGRVERIKVLQLKWRDRTTAEQDELDALRRELAVSPELPDDPRTPFVNEARSPNIDGTDYLEQLRKRECDKLLAEAIDIGARYGAAVLEAVFQAALKR